MSTLELDENMGPDKEDMVSDKENIALDKEDMVSESDKKRLISIGVSEA